MVDRHQEWACAAFEAASEEWRTGAYDAVLITMSPFSLAHAGDALRRECGAKVVYDLRDPWTLDGWPAYRSVLQWRSHRRLMVRALSEATGVIANTPEAGRCLGEVLPRLDPARLAVIPNGYDAEDFEGLDEERPDPARFTIVLTGSVLSDVLYPKPGARERLKRALLYRAERIYPEGRTMKFLLEALRLLVERGHPLADRVRVVVAGSNDASTERSVRESGVEERVELLGYLPHSESVRWLGRADALFLPLHGLPPGARSRIVPGKTYEYLASGRPILGCLPEGDARELVVRSGVGFIADPCDAASIAARLEELLALWSAGALPRGPAAWVGEYERGVQAGTLASFLARTCLRDAGGVAPEMAASDA